MSPNTHEWKDERKNCTQVLITDWGEGKEDDYKYEVDLVNPIISLNNPNLYSLEIQLFSRLSDETAGKAKCFPLYFLRFIFIKL